MLRILGSPKRLCNGLTRRDFLRVGGVGALAAAGLPDVSAAASKPRSFGRAKHLILIHLYGSPSQLETFDPKPDAPEEVRGTLGAIRSSLPGALVGELLPKSAAVMHRCTTIRSLTHPYPLHGVAFALTGVPAIDVPMELNPRDPRHWPFFGSVVDYVEAMKTGGKAKREVPANFALPWKFSSRRKGEVPRAGPYAAFLGGAYDPVWADFVGEATKGHIKTLQDQTYEGNDPYVGCAGDSHFVVPAATSMPAEVTLDRLDQRRTLLEQLEGARLELDKTAAGRSHDRYRDMAFAMANSTTLRSALDLRKEPQATRDLYGPTLFGKGCLAARRLVEAGGRVVTLFWDEFGLAGSGWDTHWDHFDRMKKELCPGFDQGWHGLITDLDRRGLLDDVLVVCTSEHGRTPRMNKAKGGGRDHWSRVYSSVLSGAGVKRGLVIGSSDRQASDVSERPVSPKDLLATMYHLLGIDHRQIIRDTLGRPLPLVDGEVIEEALA
jgi:uncharacterized protein (DUF1501 family)